MGSETCISYIRRNSIYTGIGTDGIHFIGRRMCKNILHKLCFQYFLPRKEYTHSKCAFIWTFFQRTFTTELYYFSLAVSIFSLLTTGIADISFWSLLNFCNDSTISLAPELHLMIFTDVLAFFMIMIPFWIINRIWRNSVLDYRERTGICYEPVLCCSCMWHI